MVLTQATARENLKRLIADFENLDDFDRNTMSEASVVRQFGDRLFGEVLGWPTRDSQRYKYELTTVVGRPDTVLFLENGEKIYVEGKRFGRIKDLAQAKQRAENVYTPSQLLLTGMVTDRTPEEQQAINYAFFNNGTWAILTNFEKFRLFNARRDLLVLSFESPSAYLADFDLFWQLSYENILQGSLDALSQQRWRQDIDAEYLSFINTEREKLAKDLIAHPEVNPWILDADNNINLNLLRSVVQRMLDRMVIIRFAEDHLVIPFDTLRRYYDLCQNTIYADSLNNYISVFFRKFDENHNSSLFSEGIVDQAVFSNEALFPLVERLYEARYRSMQADIIGNTYEQYLGKALVLDKGSVSTRDNLETRKKQGSYYTPQVIVQYIVDNSLGRYLYGTHNGKPDGTPLEGMTRKTSHDIVDLTVLDSACGSGSFLIYAYEVLAVFYESELRRLDAELDDLAKDFAKRFMDLTFEDRVARERIEQEIARLQAYPRLILEHHIYGVDLDPQAAEIAVVNLMMRGMERNTQDKRLPLILNQNVKVGNGLIGVRPDDPIFNDHAPTLKAIRALRRELIGTLNTDPRHDEIYDELVATTASLNATLQGRFAEHFSDVSRIRPFNWGVEFPEVFFNEDGTPKDNAGFDIIIGNPPWEIVKPDLREFYAQFDDQMESKYSRRRVDERVIELNAEDPRREVIYLTQTQTIEESAKYFRATDDYTQQGRGDTATHKLFMERVYGLLSDGGRLGYLVPSGIYTDLGTKQLREMLLNHGNIETLISLTNGCSGGEAYFPSIHRSFKIAILLTQKGTETDTFNAIFRIEPRTVPKPDELLAYLDDTNNFIRVEKETIQRFSPDSLSVMEFQSSTDYEVAEKIYADHPLMGDEVVDWTVKFTREFDMTNDRHLFNRDNKGLPLYEGKMIHQYDAYFADPQYWVQEDKGRERLANKTGNGYQQHRLVFRDIASSTNERTLISTVLPKKTFCNNKTPVVQIDSKDYENTILYTEAVMNSFVLDYLIRQKISSTLNFFYMQTLPLPRLTAGNVYFDALVERSARLTCVREEFADLWQDVMGSEWLTPPPSPLPASSEGEQKTGSTSADGLYPVIDEDERQVLRDEIDALVAHLYGLSRAEFKHILGTFPLVFPDDEAGRMKRDRLLDVYEAMAGFGG